MSKNKNYLPKKGSHQYLSNLEQEILNSSAPIDIKDGEDITVLGHRGVWVNKAEVVNWKGPIPINQYNINQDPNPQVIKKKSKNKLNYKQELAVRYLQPPTPEAPGEIIINQEADKVPPPAPPLIIRQYPSKPVSPEPLIIREAPPEPPKVERKVVHVPGKVLPPPDRKLVIEKLPKIPAQPPQIFIERWLPYGEQKVKIIHQKSNVKEPVQEKTRNVYINWEKPDVDVEQEVKYLGVSKVDPKEYMKQHGSSLKVSRELPDFVKNIPPPKAMNSQRVQGVTVRSRVILRL